MSYSPSGWAEAELARAIFGALDLWSNPKYKSFLLSKVPGRLDEKWFDFFTGRWSIARTIKKKNKVAVREYLDSRFRATLEAGGGPKEVDAASEYIRKCRWSSQVKKDGDSSLPISLVSKVGFLLKPDLLIPYDSYSRKGINKLRGTKKDDGLGHLDVKTYVEYFSEFESRLGYSDRQIAGALREGWVKELAAKLGCGAQVLTRPGFKRKVFDNLLMNLGGRSD